MTLAARLSVDPALLPAWDSLVPAGITLCGLAAASIADRASLVVATDVPVPDAVLAELARTGAERLAVQAVEVVALSVAPGTTWEGLLRQWVNQAAQGSGRGVVVRVQELDDPPLVRVLVQAVDSSARELAQRLASPYEPALPALRALLGGRPVVVEDAEGP